MKKLVLLFALSAAVAQTATAYTPNEEAAFNLGFVPAVAATVTCAVNIVTPDAYRLKVNAALLALVGCSYLAVKGSHLSMPRKARGIINESAAIPAAGAGALIGAGVGTGIHKILAKGISGLAYLAKKAVRK